MPTNCRILCVSACACLVGCAPWTMRWPSLVNTGAEYERREAQVQDPFPDQRLGPDVGFRPLGFESQRSEPQVARDRFGTAQRRRTQGNPFAPPPTSGRQYPAVVQ